MSIPGHPLVRHRRLINRHEEDRDPKGDPPILPLCEIVLVNRDFRAVNAPRPGARLGGTAYRRLTDLIALAALTAIRPAAIAAMTAVTRRGNGGGPGVVQTTNASSPRPIATIRAVIQPRGSSRQTARAATATTTATPSVTTPTATPICSAAANRGPDAYVAMR